LTFQLNYEIKRLVCIAEAENQDLGVAMQELGLLNDYPYPISTPVRSPDFLKCLPTFI